MKTAVVLAGGKGLRFCSETPKPMILINHRPVIEYTILKLKTLGFKNVYIVVGFKKEQIMEYFKDGGSYGLDIKYIENKYINDAKRSGLSDAVLLARDFIADDCFMTILGDEIYANTKHREMIDFFENDSNCECMIAVNETENIEYVKRNYSVKLDNNNVVLDLEEKPQNPWNNLIGCGTYLFRPSIFTYIERTKPSIRTGRRELTETLKLIVQDKKVVKAFNIGGKYLNLTYVEDLDVAEKILKEEKINGNH